jgi:2-polyprenyl-6-hydroxyphenyl methylase/3-demethylubiquinone-9 3-methyltransferase
MLAGRGLAATTRCAQIRHVALGISLARAARYFPLQHFWRRLVNLSTMSTAPDHVSGPSVDEREVAFFNSLAATWWDTSGPFWPLHRLNQLRSTWIAARIAQHFERDLDSPAPLAGLRVLDVGCGGGILSESIAGLGASVVGIDVVKKNVAVARAHGRQGACDVEYRCTTAEALAATGETFDVVLNMEVVEHVSDVTGFMGACSALVARGGLMFVATLNRTAKSWLFGIVGAEYILRWLPRGTHRWDWFRTPSEIGALLERHGFEVGEKTGVKVNPISRRFRVHPSLQVNYMLWASKSREHGTPDVIPA